MLTGFVVGTALATLLCRAGAAANNERAIRNHATDELLKAVRDFSPRHETLPAFKNNLKAVKDALRRGADPNARYGTSTSTVAVTCLWVHRHIPGSQNDPDTTFEATDHFPVMLRAAELGNEPVIHLLLAAGADPNLRGDGSESTLYLAAGGRSATLTATLLDLGMHPNQKSGICVSPRDLETMGSLPLQGGICSSAVIKLLLSRGADPRLLVRGKPIYQYEREMSGRVESDDSRHRTNLTARQMARQQATEKEVSRSLSLMESAATRRQCVASR